MHSSAHLFRLRRPLFLVLASLSVVASTVACGGGAVPPTMAGRQGMLSQTAVAQKCEEAAKGHDRPFVVEWDATDLASFEAKAARDTIFVKYEGCKLVVLDRCSDGVVSGKLGSYGTPQFTTGTVQGFEIKNEGELYAKLPLGALSLAGELKTRGSLEVETTVVGQLQLVGKAADDATSGAECGRATHLVTALSVGAFRLVAGGEVSAGAKVEVGPAGAGLATDQAKSVLRTAGDAAACRATRDDAPHVDCRSPIQIFLSPIRRSVPLQILSPLPSESP